MKKNKFIKSIIMMLLVGGIFFTAKDSWVATNPVLSDYTAYPPFVIGSSNKANVMILFSNDHTNFYKGYNDTVDIDGDGDIDSDDTTYNNLVDYYGYFDPDKCYNYTSSTFVPAAAASSHQCTSSRWSGNFLNWLSMSHGDFVRKALTGGRRVMDSATRTTLKRADIYDSAHSWNKVYLGAGIASYTPFTYNASGRTFRNSGTSLLTKVGNDSAWTGTGATNTYTVEVEVCNNTIGLEDNCKTYQNVGVTTYKPAGLIVKYADQVRFGLMTYSVDSYNDKGGILRRNIGDVVNEINPNGTINSGVADSIIRYINAFSPKGWDPVAEMYYEAIRYFKALAPTTTYRCGGGGPTDDSFPMYCNQSASRRWTDPMQSYCQKNYIIIVNDEYPSRDHDDLPSSAFSTGVAPNDSGINTYNSTNSVGSSEGINTTSQQVGNLTGAASGSCAPAEVINSLANVTGICPSEPTAQGTFNIAGLAYYAHTEDIRTGNCGGAACTNSQTIKTYAIAFRASPGGYQIPGDMNGDGDFVDAGDNRSMNQLYLAAKYGGFEDSDGDNQPFTDSTCGTGSPNSKCKEWDEDGNNVPDNYFTAEKGADFENAMNSIMADILKRASSGTSASVLATTGEGAGAIYQAYFIPKKTSGSTTVTWLGYVQGLFIDKKGNIREDTNNNDTLDYSGDYIIQMAYNTTTSTTDVYKYNDTNGDNVADDTDGDGNVNGDHDDAITGSPFALSDIIPIWEAGNVLWSTSPGNRVIKTSILDTCISTTCTTTTGGFIDFATTNRTALRPYLRAANDNEAEAIIRYIRGEDTPITIAGTTYNYRSRTLTIGGTSNTWKLGDVVYSTPTPVTKPSENYDFIYGDSTYAAFKTQYLNRRHVVYAGANDGMLHAFNGGVFNTTTNQYTGSGYTLGQELFAFIPQSLLPHLKWLTDTDYTHVYYVDLKPKVTDARIFTADATHPNGWGTVLIGGMRFGGRDITYSDTSFSPNQKTFYSAYFALDITNPDASDGSYGRLLWVYTDTGASTAGDLNMTSSYPAVARTGISSGTGTWHVVFGSGPTSYTGASTKSGKIYVLDLATGALSIRFDNQAVLMDNAFMADPITVDVDLDYQVDTIYIGNTYCPSGTGCTSSTWAGKMYRIATGEDTNPANWQVPSLLFEPINTLLTPNEGQPITSAPSVALDEKANLWVFFGTGRFLDISDRTLDGTERWSFYGIKDTCKPWINPTCPTYTPPDKANGDLYDASSVIVCQGGSTTCAGGTAWSTVLNTAKNKPGWYVDFSTAGERTLFKPAVIGGLAVWTTYTPNTNVCASEGTSNIYAAFYKTGTAYEQFVFDQTGTGIAVDRSLSLGTGLPSSVGIMVTGDNEMVGFVQQSTGTIVQIRQTTPFALKGEVIGWKRGLIP